MNARVANTTSEDPHFPKVQFPAQTHCPQCYATDDAVATNATLDFLVDMYTNIDTRHTAHQTGGGGDLSTGSTSDAFLNVVQSGLLVLFSLVLML